MTERSYIAVIRHGDYHQRKDVPSARQPFGLTDTGIAQAQSCGDLLAEMAQSQRLEFAPMIHCSRQLRAWQTASRIAGRLRGLGHEIDALAETSALAERGLGSAANLTVAEIDAVMQADPRYPAPPAGWKSDSDYRLPLEGAESLMEAGARVAACLTEIAEAGRGRLNIVVGHGASIRHACHHLGLLTRAQIAQLSMFHARPLLLCYSGHDNWQHLAGAWKVRPPKEEALD
ncbi:histidine phosphatase family protein [Celeribacter halophilus]|uniref:histidine phosphatase family protein n=1 Tax=Celeribacter halophilus TaxID=576117 RepID=UPI001C0891A4|nr:histidine phosphatase family protein [Celeribacter halophilus]MBU2890622.1 histidine phosphatase family protein [Celeribacter halophilus]MDO6510213.1 histidine phosphatase family protein [Celeribacter halophilus]